MGSQVITSPQNPRLKELRKLHDRRHRDRTRQFIAEGEDLLLEAVRHGALPRVVFHDPDELSREGPLLRDLPDEVEVVAVKGDVLRASGTLGSGSRLIGVWDQDVADRPPSTDVALYLNEVADPGNVGTVLRSALAFVPSVVLLSPGTADPFSPKAVRASMGAIFGQAVARIRFDQLRQEADSGTRLVALAPRAGKTLHDADVRPPVTFCLGAERLGLPDDVIAACDEVCHVPLRADAESLNVAMVATLCLYELSLHKLSASS